MKKRILYYLFILLLFPHNGTGQTVARMSDRPVNTSQWITTHFARGVVHPTFSNPIFTKAFTVLSPVWQIPFKGSKQYKKNAAHCAIVLVVRHFLMLEFLYLIFFNHFLCPYNTKYGAKIDTFLIIPKIFI